MTKTDEFKKIVDNFFTNVGCLKGNKEEIKNYIKNIQKYISEGETEYVKCCYLTYIHKKDWEFLTKKAGEKLFKITQPSLYLGPDSDKYFMPYKLENINKFNIDDEISMETISTNEKTLSKIQDILESCRFEGSINKYKASRKIAEHFFNII